MMLCLHNLGLSFEGWASDISVFLVPDMQSWVGWRVRRVSVQRRENTSWYITLSTVACLTGFGEGVEDSVYKNDVCRNMFGKVQCGRNYKYFLCVAIVKKREKYFNCKCMCPITVKLNVRMGGSLVVSLFLDLTYKIWRMKAVRLLHVNVFVVWVDVNVLCWT